MRKSGNELTRSKQKMCLFICNFRCIRVIVRMYSWAVCVYGRRGAGMHKWQS